ncbi:hypothetical protein Fmac_018592 [Flemingia macrophylla]|uniref:Transglycosylase SLT domain-containing protein n=1 Tax=Flemingia macrophylla TaxID=520843 RepID=A0ABD1M5I0_9FABA
MVGSWTMVRWRNMENGELKIDACMMMIGLVDCLPLNVVPKEPWLKGSMNNLKAHEWWMDEREQGDEQWNLIVGILGMAISFSYWDDCVDPQDLEAMWNVPEVSAEWLKDGEDRFQRVHLSRDPDGQSYLTQTEMRAVTDIIIRRHFHSEIDPGMICAIAELESDRQLLATNSCQKSKDPTVGLMQLSPKNVEWLMRYWLDVYTLFHVLCNDYGSPTLTKACSELGYCSYAAEGKKEFLFKPFVNVYFGAAYIKWLSNFDNKKRSEEFIVRAYKGGTKMATHKSTLHYWQCYLSVKETFPSRKSVDDSPLPINDSAVDHSHPISSSENPRGLLDFVWMFGCSVVLEMLCLHICWLQVKVCWSGVMHDQFWYTNEDASVDTYWDSRVSPEDMEAMWNHHEVRKAWNRTKEKRGKVRFAHNEEKKPYLSRVEMKAVADIVLFKYQNTLRIKSTVLCAIGEVLSMRFVHGVGERLGIMGIDYSTAYRLYLEMGYRNYRLESADDLNNPFVSMYFGAAYVAWLSEYDGRERTLEFFVQAYFVGPENVNPEDTSTLWLKFEETLSKYEETKRHKTFVPSAHNDHNR